MDTSPEKPMELPAMRSDANPSASRPSNEIQNVVTLEKLEQGAGGTIVALAADNLLQGRLMGLGLSIGARFRILHVSGHRRRIFRLAVHETRLALDCDVAQFILVEPD